MCSWVLIVVEVVVTLVRPVHALQSANTVLHPKVLFRTLVPGVTWLWASLWRDNIYIWRSEIRARDPQNEQTTGQIVHISTKSKQTKTHEKWFRGSRNLRIRKF